MPPPLAPLPRLISPVSDRDSTSTRATAGSRDGPSGLASNNSSLPNYWLPLTPSSPALMTPAGYQFDFESMDRPISPAASASGTVLNDLLGQSELYRRPSHALSTGSMAPSPPPTEVPSVDGTQDMISLFDRLNNPAPGAIGGELERVQEEQDSTRAGTSRPPSNAGTGTTQAGPPPFSMFGSLAPVPRPVPDAASAAAFGQLLASLQSFAALYPGYLPDGAMPPGVMPPGVMPPPLTNPAPSVSSIATAPPSLTAANLQASGSSNLLVPGVSDGGVAVRGRGAVKAGPASAVGAAPANLSTLSSSPRGIPGPPASDLSLDLPNLSASVQNQQLAPVSNTATPAPALNKGKEKEKARSGPVLITPVPRNVAPLQISSGSPVPQTDWQSAGAKPKTLKEQAEMQRLAREGGSKTLRSMCTADYLNQMDVSKTPKNPLRSASWSPSFSSVYAERHKTFEWLRNPTDVLTSLNSFVTTIVSGPSGAGKSSQITQLAVYWAEHNRHVFANKQVVLITPDETAGELLLKRVRTELDLDGSKLAVRFSPQTEDEVLGPMVRLVIATPQFLVRALSNDGLLSKTSILIMDDLQERQVVQDILTTRLRQFTFEQVRTDFRLILITSQEDVRFLAGGFARPSLGIVQFHPTDGSRPLVHYETNAVGDYPSHVVSKVKERFAQGRAGPRGDVVVYCTNPAQVRKISRLLEIAMQQMGEATIKVRPLHAGIPLSERIDAVSPRRSTSTPPHIFVTDSSSDLLNFVQADILFDNGTTELAIYNPSQDSTNFLKVAITKQMATQRATRISSGDVMRVYPLKAFESLQPLNEPEVKYCDFSRGLLTMAYLQRSLPTGVDMPRLPTPASGPYVIRALRTLRLLSAIDANMDCTLAGALICNLPLDLHLGRAVVAAGPLAGCGEELRDLAAAVTMGDKLFVGSLDDESFYNRVKAKFGDPFGDFGTLLNVYRQYLSHETEDDWKGFDLISKAGAQEASLLANSMRYRLGATTAEFNRTDVKPSAFPKFSHLAKTDPRRFELLGRVILAGYYPRVIRKTDEGDWITWDGNHPVTPSAHSACVVKHGYLVAGEFRVDPKSGRTLAINLTPVTQEQLIAVVPHITGYQTNGRNE